MKQYCIGDIICSLSGATHRARMACHATDLLSIADIEMRGGVEKGCFLPPLTWFLNNSGCIDRRWLKLCRLVAPSIRKFLRVFGNQCGTWSTKLNLLQKKNISWKYAKFTNPWHFRTKIVSKLFHLIVRKMHTDWSKTCLRVFEDLFQLFWRLYNVFMCWDSSLLRSFVISLNKLELYIVLLWTLIQTHHNRPQFGGVIQAYRKQNSAQIHILDHPHLSHIFRYLEIYFHKPTNENILVEKIANFCFFLIL